MRDANVNFCPVPKEQQPINEYEQLKESWFFSWVTLDKFTYLKKITWVWLWGWLISGPISAASFVPNKHPFLFALSAGMGSAILVVLCLIRLYLGWSYIGDRLRQEKIVYEESGWYDGQVWPKTPEILTRDRLIVSYQIEPILLLVRKTLLHVTVLLALGVIVWLWH